MGWWCDGGWYWWRRGRGDVPSAAPEHVRRALYKGRVSQGGVSAGEGGTHTINTHAPQGDKMGSRGTCVCVCACPCLCACVHVLYVAGCARVCFVFHVVREVSSHTVMRSASPPLVHPSHTHGGAGP